MRQEDAELDYLAPTQLERDPKSFSEVVKEAFLLEHGVKQQQYIAEILGVDKSRVTQMFSDPRNLKPETIRAILSCLKRPAHRKSILKAWNREAFSEEIAKVPKGRLTAGTVGESAIRRIDRMIRESRLDLAARLAMEVADVGADLETRERALDLAYFTRQRLDEPGHAMLAAKRIVIGARERKEPYREACGHLFRVRTLIGLTDCTPEEIDPILDLAETLAAGSGLPPGYEDRIR